jgi:hypothetical protein
MKKIIFTGICMVPTLVLANNLSDTETQNVAHSSSLPNKKNTFELNANIKYIHASWDSGISVDDSKAVEPRLTYETESIAVQEASIEANLFSKPIFNFYKLKTNGTQEQAKALLKNTNANAAIDGFGFKANAEALIKLFNIHSKFLSTLLSYQIVYRDETYYGTATANKKLVYWYTTAETAKEGEGADYFEKGDALSFRTDFKHVEHSISLDYLNENKEKFVRLGYYETKYKKPAYMGNQAENDDGDKFDIFEKVTYETKGLMLSVKNFDGSKHQGVNYNVALYYGLSNEMSANGYALTDGLAENETLDYTAVYLDYSYKWNMIQTQHNRLYFTLGGSIDYKNWSISDNSQSSDDSNSIDLEEERLYKMYMELNYRFSI